MVDIFQYSNIYVLKPSIQWLAEDLSVQAECGPYVTLAGKYLPSGEYNSNTAFKVKRHNPGRDC
jgi:hypothetical protein